MEMEKWRADSYALSVLTFLMGHLCLPTFQSYVRKKHFTIEMKALLKVIKLAGFDFAPCRHVRLA